jgi:uncharacterized membrane protein YuzA (DUF378 family)
LLGGLEKNNIILLISVFAIIPLIIGVLTLRLSLRGSQTKSIWKRVYFVILGVAALFSWAGLIMVFGFAAALMPTRIKRYHRERIDNNTSAKSR